MHRHEGGIDLFSSNSRQESKFISIVSFKKYCCWSLDKPQTSLSTVFIGTISFVECSSYNQQPYLSRLALNISLHLDCTEVAAEISEGYFKTWPKKKNKQKTNLSALSEKTRTGPLTLQHNRGLDNYPWLGKRHSSSFSTVYPEAHKQTRSTRVTLARNNSVFLCLLQEY